MLGGSYIPELKTAIFILLYLGLFTSSIKKKSGIEWFSWFTHLHSSTNADGTLNKYCEAQPVMSNSQPHNSYEPVFFREIITYSAVWHGRSDSWANDSYELDLFSESITYSAISDVQFPSLGLLQAYSY